MLINFPTISFMSGCDSIPDRFNSSNVPNTEGQCSKRSNCNKGATSLFQKLSNTIFDIFFPLIWSIKFFLFFGDNTDWLVVYTLYSIPPHIMSPKLSGSRSRNWSGLVGLICNLDLGIGVCDLYIEEINSPGLLRVP
jgi:hypothetical protein